MRVLARVASVAALAAAGCAADHASYAQSANEICAGVVGESRRLYQTVGPGRSARDRAFARIAKQRRAALDELHALTPPPGKRTKYAAMLRHFDESQRMLDKAKRAFGKKEDAPFLLVFAAREGSKGHPIARDLGLADCAGF